MSITDPMFPTDLYGNLFKIGSKIEYIGPDKYIIDHGTVCYIQKIWYIDGTADIVLGDEYIFNVPLHKCLVIIEDPQEFIERLPV